MNEPFDLHVGRNDQRHRSVTLCLSKKQRGINRGSYMSANVLLNLFNELRIKIRCKAVPSILSVFPDEFKTFNNTRARMQDSIYHMTL